MLKVTVVAVIVAVGAALLPSPAAQPRASDPTAGVASFVEAQVEASRLVHAAVGVIEHGQITLQESYGSDEEHPFLIGSVSKSFTALAIMQLVEAGELGLDDTVVSHLPEFATRDTAVSDSITIHHLLTHTSGIPTAVTRQYLTGDMPASFEARIANLAQVELVSAPGAEFHYANEGYATLGRLVEVASGRPFGAYLDERIFTPLGMHASRGAVVPLEAGHMNVFGLKLPQAEHYTEGFIADGFITSTLSDMLRYAAFLLGDGTVDGQRVLSAEGLALLQTGQVAVVPGAAAGDAAVPQYAYGWGVAEVNGQRVVQHAGDVRTFHADIGLVPATGSAVVVLIDENSSLMAPGALYGGTLQLLTGGEPPSVSHAYGIATAIVIAAALLSLAAMAWGARRMRRWRRALPALTARRRFGPLVSDAALLLALLVGVPASGHLLQGSPLTPALLLTSLPDVGGIYVAAVVYFGVKVIVRCIALGPGGQPATSSSTGSTLP
jgi:CubicO group peptidase (beta-lactamase class C family)